MTQAFPTLRSSELGMSLWTSKEKYVASGAKTPVERTESAKSSWAVGLHLRRGRSPAPAHVASSRPQWGIRPTLAAWAFACACSRCELRASVGNSAHACGVGVRLRLLALRAPGLSGEFGPRLRRGRSPAPARVASSRPQWGIRPTLAGGGLARE